MAIGAFAIVAEAFPLWPYWPKAAAQINQGSKALFAVTLNTGIVAATSSDLQDTFAGLGVDLEGCAQALMPWRWTIGGFKLCALRRSNGLDATVFDGSPIGTLPGNVRLSADAAHGLPAFEQQLEGFLSRITRGWTNLAPVRLDPGTLSTVVDSAPTLQGLLANVATWPVPLAHLADPMSPQGVNLAHLVATPWSNIPLKRDANGQPVFGPNGKPLPDDEFMVVAAPVFNTFQPDGLPTYGDPAFQWAYTDTGGGAVPRIAYSGGADLRQPDAEKVQYDSRSYFVARSAHVAAGALGKNPVADLPLRVAERFDLGALVVSEMHRRVSKPALGDDTSPAGWEAARQALIAVARDMAGAGFQPPTADETDRHESLLCRLMRDVGEGVGSADLVTLIGNWQNQLVLEDWEQIVLTVAPDLADEMRFAALGSNPALTEAERNQARLDALGRIAAALHENEVLRLLWVGQVREALVWGAAHGSAGVGPAQEFWNGVESRFVSEVLPTYNLTQSLVLDHIRAFLLPRAQQSEPGILPARDELFDGANSKRFADVLREKFRARFGVYAVNRFGGTDIRTPRCAGFTCDPASYLDVVTPKLLPDIDDDSTWGPSSPTPRPHGLTVPVAPLHAPGDPANAEDNVSTDIAGYGVLIRRTKKTKTATENDWAPWRLPLMASVRFDRERPGDDPIYLARASDGKRIETAVPIALGYGALRDGFLTYDEEPLAAHDAEMPSSTAGASEDYDVPVVDFIVPGQELKNRQGHEIPPPYDLDGLGKGWRDLPELAFGASYRLAPFVFGHACTLPPALALQPDLNVAHSTPHVLKEHDDLSADDVPVASVRKMRYLRRVPVGPLRVDTGDAKFRRAQEAAGEVVTIASALPPSGRVVHRHTDEGRFFHAEGEGGLLDIFKASRWSLRFGGLRTSGGDGVVLDADWEWGAGPERIPAAVVRRVANSIKVSIGAADLTFANVLTAGVASWIWLSLETEADPSGKWSIAVQCGTQGVASAVQRAEYQKPQGASELAWLRLKQLNGDLLLQPSVTVNGFAPVGSARSDAAVILLSSSRSEGGRTFKLPVDCTLGIKPPAVGDDTFARWLRLDQFLDTKNSAGQSVDWKKVIQFAPLALRRLREKLGKEPEPRAVLEDPAVTHIVAELVPVRGLQAKLGEKLDKSPERQVCIVPIATPPRDAVTDPSGIQDKQALIGILKALAQSPTSVTAACKVADAPAGPRLIVDGTSFAVTVAPGEVWDLRFYPAADQKLFQADEGGDDAARFHPGLGAPQTAIDAGGGVSLVLFSPMDYRIEAARKECVPESRASEDLIWEGVRPTAIGDSISVRLARPEHSRFAPTVWRPWDNIGEAELGYQAFVWSGRPLESYPFGKANGGIDAFPHALAPPPADGGPPPEPASSARDNVMLWEAAGFENQEGRAPLTATRAWPPAANDVVLFETDLKAERNGSGAQHYRFRLDVRHRYSALADETNPKSAADLRHSAEQKFAGMKERWKRLFVPARPRSVLPPPAVTFVVPLTDPQPDRTVPGLIAYLDEPWAAIGGLAEILDVQIAPAFEPADGAESRTPERRKVKENRQWPEFGPDPIVRSGNFNGRDVFVPVGVSDLIGQTFDTGTATPGIHGASALIPPPVVDAGGKQFDAAWSMAKLRFRRMLHPMAVADQPIAIDTPTTTLDRDLILIIGKLKGLADKDRVTISDAGGKALIALTAESILGAPSIIRLTRTGPGADPDPNKDSARVSPISIGTDEHRLYVCLRRAGLRSGAAADTGEQGFEITVYANDQAGTFRPVGLGMFPASFGAELSLRVNGAVANLAWSRAPFHASDWTPAYWSQYLGAITNATNSGNAKRVDDLALEVAGSTDSDRRKLRIKADGAAIQLKPRWPKPPAPAEGTPPEPDLPPGGWTDHSGLYYRVLVTKTVYDASGTLGGEAIVGLYEGEEADPTKLRMIWPSTPPPDLSGLEKRLHARIMLWQEAPAAMATEYSAEKPWDMIFPSEPEEERFRGARREARARILQISPPISG